MGDIAVRSQTQVSGQGPVASGACVPPYGPPGTKLIRHTPSSGGRAPSKGACHHPFVGTGGKHPRKRSRLPSSPPRWTADRGAQLNLDRYYQLLGHRQKTASNTLWSLGTIPDSDSATKPHIVAAVPTEPAIILFVGLTLIADVDSRTKNATVTIMLSAPARHPQHLLQRVPNGEVTHRRWVVQLGVLSLGLRTAYASHFPRSPQGRSK